MNADESVVAVSGGEHLSYMQQHLFNRGGGYDKSCGDKDQYSSHDFA
jgi:hypothetical protein